MSALLTVVGRAYGDELVVTDFSIAAGETKTMSVVLNNPTSDYIAFEIYMSLPTGISIVADDNGYLMVSLNSNRASRHIIEVNMIDNGDYHFLCYSNGNDTFKERSGELFTMTLKADDNATSGTFEGIIYNQIFSDPNKQQVDFADYLFSATITGERVLDENSTTAPATATNVDVRVNRTLKAGVWSTICLPFAMTEAQVKEAFGEDVELGDFQGTESDFDGDNVIAITAKFDIVTAIEANHPYIIKAASAITNFIVDDVNITPDEDEAYIEFDNGKTGSRRVVYSGFYGTYHANTELEKYTLFLNNNKFWYSTGKTKMKGYRAYFDFLDILTEVEESAAPKITWSIEGKGGDVTKIDGRTMEQIET